MVTILVTEQVIFLVIADNREIPVTIIVTFFGDNIVIKYGDNFFTKNGDFPGESPKMVTILVKEQVIFLVIAENREVPVTIIVTFFGDNIVTKYGDDFFTGNGGFPSESP